MRLWRWLQDLKILSRRHGLTLDMDDEQGGELRVIDLRARTIVGVGIVPQLDDRGSEGLSLRVIDCAGSILDGSWLVEQDGKLIEQRHLNTEGKR